MRQTGSPDATSSLSARKSLTARTGMTGGGNFVMVRGRNPGLSGQFPVSSVAVSRTSTRATPGCLLTVRFFSVMVMPEASTGAPPSGALATKWA